MYVYFVFILALIIGAILNIPFNLVITAFLNSVDIPLDMGGGFISFIQALKTWFLLIVVLIPMLIWVFVNSQKPRNPYE